MLNDDLAIGADDSRKEFVEQMEKHNSKIVFGVQVLTTGYWPTYSSPSITVPDEMTKCLDIFKTWHDQRYQQRKLSWVLSLFVPTLGRRHTTGYNHAGNCTECIEWRKYQVLSRVEG